MAAKCEQSPNSTENPTNVLGDLSEGTIFIENKQARALIDTGSMVSTVSQSFYDQHLTHKIIIIECADGRTIAIFRLCYGTSKFVPGHYT